MLLSDGGESCLAETPSSVVDRLPMEMMRHIASFLCPKAARALRQVSVRWRAAVDSVPALLAVRVPSRIEPASFWSTVRARHLTFASSVVIADTATLHLDAVQSMTAHLFGEKNPSVDTILTETTSLRKVHLKTSLPDNLVAWPEPQLHTHLSEVHLDFGQTTTNQLAKSIVSALRNQLRVLSVPTLNDLVVELPLLETLSVNLQNPAAYRGGLIHTVPIAAPNHTPLRFYRLSSIRTVYTPSIADDSDPITAPRLRTLTIKYTTNGDAYSRFVLPSLLPCHQLTHLTLINAVFLQWTDLFLLPLPQIVQLSVRDPRMLLRHCNWLLPKAYMMPPIERRRVHHLIPKDWPGAFWCVAPNLRRLSISQRPKDDDTLGCVFSPYTHTMQLLLYDAFPRLEHLDLVTGLETYEHTSWHVLAASGSTLQQLWDHEERLVSKSEGFCPQTHQTTFDYSSRTILVSYLLLDNPPQDEPTAPPVMEHCGCEPCAVTYKPRICENCRGRVVPIRIGRALLHGSSSSTQQWLN